MAWNWRKKCENWKLESENCCRLHEQKSYIGLHRYGQYAVCDVSVIRIRAYMGGKKSEDQRRKNCLNA